MGNKKFSNKSSSWCILIILIYCNKIIFTCVFKHMERTVFLKYLKIILSDFRNNCSK